MYFVNTFDCGKVANASPEFDRSDIASSFSLQVCLQCSMHPGKIKENRGFL